MVGASLEEVEAALQAQPDDLGWSWASEHVIPVMPRVRAYPPGAPEPLRTMVPPAWLWLEIASADPNCLGPIGYRFDGSAVRPESLERLLGPALELDEPAGPAFVA
jgi:hypothetical protein